MAWTTERQTKNDPDNYITMVLSEEVADDSNKDLLFTDIGYGEHAEIVAIRIEYAATATAGTRRINLEVLDSASDVVRVIEFAATIVANTSEDFEAAPGLVATAGTDVNYEQLPTSLFLFGGQTLRIRDVTASDAAADDMVVHVTAKLFQ